MKMGVESEHIQNLDNHLFTSILTEHRKVNQLRPPKVQDTSYNSLLQSFELIRGQNIPIRCFATGRGHGPFIELSDESVKYDLISTGGINLLGHSHPLMIRAQLDSAKVDTNIYSNYVQYPETAMFAQQLIKCLKGSRLEHFWYAGSGSMAADMAIKILWQKCTPRYGIISFTNNFSGRSIATQEVTDQEQIKGKMPSLLKVAHIPHFNSSNPQKSLRKTLDALNTLVIKSPQSYGILNIELVQGQVGANHGTTEFYTELFKHAHKLGLLIWVDEIQTFGRTEQMFAFQNFKLDEYVDLITVGKALQINGAAFSKELNPEPGLLGGTSNGSAGSLKFALSILKYLDEGPFYGTNGRIKEIEKKFEQKIKDLSQSNLTKNITNYRVLGTFISFQVSNGIEEDMNSYCQILFKNGIISSISSTKAKEKWIKFLLPLCLTDEHIEEIISIMGDSLLELNKDN